MDGQPMCSHRKLTAGTETGNTAQNDIEKAGATAIKIVQGHYTLSVYLSLKVFGCL